MGEATSARIAVAVEHRHLVAEARQRLALLLEPRLLVGVGQREQLAGGLEVAVDAVALEVGPQPVEVLQAEPLEHRHLVGEAREPVLDAVRERGDGEPAVAAAGAEARGLGLEQRRRRAPESSPWRAAPPTAR